MNKSASKQSIVERITSMHQHGNKWKERLQKAPDDFNLTRPGSVYDIQEQLNTTQANWKSRIEEKDVQQFTTEAKLMSVKNKNNPEQISCHNGDLKDNNLGNICVIRLCPSDKEDQSPPKFILEDNNTEILNQHNTNISVIESEKKVSLFGNNNGQRLHSHKVTIPRMSDKNLSHFFADSESTSTLVKTTSENVHTTDDFNEIFHETNLNLNIQKRQIKPSRKTRTTSKNPLKKLNERLDVVGEYDEIIFGIADAELKEQKHDNTKINVGFTKEALAALSSKEDFSRVKLKRIESGSMHEQFISPYKDLMLISVKGRKKVQLRLVEPIASSINCGDCYLLVTADRCFVWQGVCSNVIELNKAKELGSWIAKCKDLNYKGFADKPIVVRSSDSIVSANVVQFWSSLRCDKVHQCNNPGTAEEDDIYEKRIQTTNIVFQVIGNQLIPVEEYWGRSLKYKMLSETQVFIFDFGSELYLWNGSKADSLSRLHGKALLRQLWSRGFNYEQCNINPLDPLPESEEKAKPKKGTTRPDWVIVGRISQKGETILFKEKFSDWPESSRLIKVCNSVSRSHQNKQLKTDLQPIDLDELLKVDPPPISLTIDGKCVGRGGNWQIIEDGILRQFEISTKNIEIWHICDNAAIKVEENSMGQFCSGDAYIIRWDFDLKTLGRFQKNQAAGNLTSAFFFWQGCQTSVTEKTSSALHTINLDKDKVAQIRVKQNDESPAFCRLFGGSMIIYRGKRKNIHKEQPLMRLFTVRGEIKEESHLIEVRCEPESLRDRSSFMLLNSSNGNAYLWVGRLCSEQTKLCALHCIENINKKKPFELGLANDIDIKVQEMKQGEEHRLFWQELGAVKRWRSSNISAELTPIRGWLVSSVTNSFSFNQIKYSLNPDNGTIPSYPLLQTTLYKTSQPALFVIADLPRIYLWQGWWPHMAKSANSVSDSDIENDHKIDDWAMPKNRIAAEKLAALISLNSYFLKHESEDVSISIIYAGLEPPVFQELFPFWETNETAKEANLKKGYQMYQQDNITETLNKYLTEKFSITRLQRQPLPECVILSKIEWYLHDDEFQNLFKMSKDEFYQMTPWKQIEKKKEVNLF